MRLVPDLERCETSLVFENTNANDARRLCRSRALSLSLSLSRPRALYRSTPTLSPNDTYQEKKRGGRAERARAAHAVHRDCADDVVDADPLDERAREQVQDARHLRVAGVRSTCECLFLNKAKGCRNTSQRDLGGAESFVTAPVATAPEFLEVAQPAVMATRPLNIPLHLMIPKKGGIRIYIPREHSL